MKRRMSLKMKFLKMKSRLKMRPTSRTKPKTNLLKVKLKTKL